VSPLHQKIEDLALVVDRPPEPDQNRHFIEMPMRCGRGRGPRSSLANYDPNFNTHRLTVS
jgi:hypothetical protein